MSQPATETLAVIVERDIPFPPEKIWRALTQPSHSYEHGDTPAHGAVGLPAGSDAGVPRRQVRVAEVLWKS